MLYQIYFYVPESYVDEVKKAMFEAGGGKIGNYSCCAWQTAGVGQFKPELGSSPFLGKKDEMEFVPEYKVEMVCSADLIDTVVAALKVAHPYEEVAYGVISLSLT